MIALWAGLALANEPADELAARLLGDAPAEAPVEATAALPQGDLPWTAALGLAAAGAALVWAARRQLSSPRATSDALQIVARTGVGSAQLLLVEVQSAHGARRRLLLGAGGNALSLVADLGDDEPVLMTAESSSSAPASDGEPELVVAPSPMSEGGLARPAVRGSASDARTNAQQRGPTQDPPERVSMTDRAHRKRAAMALIDEVTRERKHSTPPTSLRAAPARGRA